MKNNKKTKTAPRHILCMFVIAMVLFSGYSCKNKINKDILYNSVFGNDYEMITEYRNFYENDSLLVRVEVTTKMPGSENKEEWIYAYNSANKKLLSIKKYDIQKDGSRELSGYDEYQDRKTISVSLDGKDTIRFRQTQVDEKGNIVRSVNKERVLECVYSDSFIETGEYSDDYIVVEEEKEYEYDDENRLVSIRRNDYIKKQMEVSRFVYESDGDTLIEKMYKNDSLQTIIKRDESNNHKTRIDYSADNRINMIQEEIKLGSDTFLIVSALSEEGFIVSDLSRMGSLDSFYIVKGKEVKSVLILPEHKSVTTFEYDKYGNITRAVNTKHFY